MTVPALELPWRTGRHVGRTIYAVPYDDHSADGVLIGVMDTPELAADAVHAHNDRHGWERVDGVAG